MRNTEARADRLTRAAHDFRKLAFDLLASGDFDQARQVSDAGTLLRQAADGLYRKVDDAAARRLAAQKEMAL
jgi:hypothetical protein